MTTPVRATSQNKEDEKQTTSYLFVPVITFAVGMAIAYLMPYRWWLNYLAFRNAVGDFLFVQNWLVSIFVAFALMMAAIILEIRAYRRKSKLSYFTPFRIVCALIALLLFVLVHAIKRSP